MVFQLKDMQDWDSIKNGRLRPVSQTFVLNEAIKEVFDMMSISSGLKGNKLSFK